MSICTRLSLCSALVLAMVSLTAAQQYSVTDLGAFPGGNVSQSQAINVVGQVAGYARFANFNAHGFFWTHKRGLVDLGSIPPKTNFSVAQGINSLGDIVEYSDYNTRTQYAHAVLWSHGDGKFGDLGTLPGGSQSQANAINDLGEITGFSNGTGIGVHAVLWTKTGGIQDLGSLPGGYSTGIAINIQGEVVGYSLAQDDSSHGVVWNKAIGMQPLPRLMASDYDGSANGINNLGQIVGGSGNLAVLWQNNKQHTVQSLGTLTENWSSAFSINDLGQVVGWSGGAAFIWTQQSGMLDLNTLIPSNSGWHLVIATSINAGGQIVGQGNINGTQHGFLLTPVSK